MFVFDKCGHALFFSYENNSAVLREVMMREAAGKTADPTNYAKGEGKGKKGRRRSALHDQVSGHGYCNWVSWVRASHPELWSRSCWLLRTMLVDDWISRWGYIIFPNESSFYERRIPWLLSSAVIIEIDWKNEFKTFVKSHQVRTGILCVLGALHWGKRIMIRFVFRVICILLCTIDIK